MTGSTTIKGLEFIEIASADPAALALQLEQLGFHLSGIHRSKAVSLYRQGSINLIMNTGPESTLLLQDQDHGHRIKAIAVQVEDVRTTYESLLSNGAWGCQSSLGAMELNIPGIEIVGGCELYLVNSNNSRFSIYDIDFTPVDNTAALSRLFTGIAGLELTISPAQQQQWQDLFIQLLGFTVNNQQLISPDSSFSLSLKSNDSITTTQEGVSAISLTATADAMELLSENIEQKAGAPTSDYKLRLPESMEFDIRVIPQ